MIDPTSICGLTIAIVDQLLKLGERTAQLISDAKSFSEDSSSLHDKIKDENNRTRQLRHVLFEPSPIYGSLTLFENFDEDVQDQIRVFLERLVHTLREGHDLLVRRYAPQEQFPQLLSPTASIGSMSDLSLKEYPPPRVPSPWRSFPRSSFNLLRWSLQDKKRTEEILRDFTDLNSRIHENIKLWCLASSFGLNHQHLRRLQNDESSKALGFDVDATLKLTASDALSSNSSFELLELTWLEALRRASPVEDRFALVKHEGKVYLQENHHLEAQVQGSDEIDPRTRVRVNDLARLLQQPKEQVFCIPRCIGWKYNPSRNCLAFIFDLPEGATPQPFSLYRLLDAKDIKPTLGERFKLALALARCISQLQMVKWVHESFRSENILFFPQQQRASPAVGHGPDPGSTATSSTPRIPFSRPCLLGFDFSRPEIDFSAGHPDVCLARDVYRHPERQGQPGKLFNKTHDIYALGVVLLEIGLWQRAITLERSHFRNARDPWVIRKQFLKQAQHRLGDKMGERYREVVERCLGGAFGVSGGDTKEDLKLQQAFRLQVVDVLERAANCL